MSWKRIFILLFSALFFLPGSNEFAYAEDGEIPTPAGDIYVQDFAKVLSQSEKQQLIGLGRAVEDKTGAQIAVLTVDSIGERDMAEYANEAFRSYGIGSKERDDGVLLVLALKDRKIRIEVGYGLEGTIPDGKAGRILDQYAIPNLRAKQPNAALYQTYKALATEVAGGESIQPSQPAPQDQGTGIPSWLFIILAIGFFILDFTFFGGTLSFALLSILSRGGGGGGGPRGGGGGSSGGGGAGRSW